MPISLQVRMMRKRDFAPVGDEYFLEHWVGSQEIKNCHPERSE
jgi:hypothetical protein